MKSIRLVSLTVLTMIAFAGNSVLCRFALKDTPIDAASFTSIRLASGALVLWALTFFLSKDSKLENNWSRTNWISAFMLFSYAAGFSFAYINLTAATGALLLFGAVQVTMIAYDVSKGERLVGQKLLGFLFALSGLVGMLLPGFSLSEFSRAPFISSALMICAGAAWGIYSLLGKGATDPIQVTAQNFMLAILFAGILSILLSHKISIDPEGVFYAIISGALASGIGYSVWYSILPHMEATNAATVQLSVPVIAALGGIIFLGEPLTWRFVLATIFILGGIGLVILGKSKKEINS